jgi:phospholipid transport system substrate-binding protein
MTLLRRGLLVGVLSAAAAMGVSCGVRAADASAAVPIAALNQAIMSAMKAGKATPFMQRYNILLPAVEQAFDLPGILQASVGPRFAALPADQQAKLLDVFRKFTVASYASNFDSDGGEKLAVLPEQRSVGAEVVVETQIVPSSGDAVRIDYVMRKGDSGWKAVDVLLNGSISQNAVKRSDFRSLVTTNSAQPLIESLQRKVGELSGGALS